MKPRVKTMKLKDGDVRALRVVRGKGTFRLVIFDEDAAVPLIQATLSPGERRALKLALSNRN